MGEYLSSQRLQHGELTVLARVLGKCTRTLREWKRRAGASGLPGRPAHSDGARRSAREHTERAWSELLPGHDGWRTVRSRLDRERVVVPTRLVQSCVRALKSESASRERVRIQVERVHVEVQARDAVWNLDQTQLARDVTALVVRDALTPAALSASIGPPASGRDSARLMEATAAQRGAWPFVVQMDNGPENNNVSMHECLERHRVIVLWNVPHTPQHNARSERGHASWKTALGVPSRWRRRDPGHGRGRDACASTPVQASRGPLILRLLHAWRRLDAETPRAEFGGLTPAELDSLAPRAEACACRGRFYTEVCEELQRIALSPEQPRARRKQEREAIWCALERHGLVTRTRGGRPIPTIKAEGVS